MLESRAFIFPEAINVWNKLSTDYVHVSSVNMFNNRIDKPLAKEDYT